MDTLELTAYATLFFTEYQDELEDLAKKLDCSVDDQKFKDIIRVLCVLLKTGDYEFDRYVSVLVQYYFEGKFEFCHEIMEKVGYKNFCVSDPYVNIWPEKFMMDKDFDIMSYGDLLTCISESINNLLRTQKYTDHEVKKKLLNNKPLKVILHKTPNSVSPIEGRNEVLMVPRTFFQLLACSCFHSTKHGAYPLIKESPWMNGQFYFNNKTYTIKDLESKFPEFTWKSTMESLKGDKCKQLLPIYPANTFYIEGDYTLEF